MELKWSMGRLSICLGGPLIELAQSTRIHAGQETKQWRNIECFIFTRGWALYLGCTVKKACNGLDNLFNMLRISLMTNATTQSHPSHLGISCFDQLRAARQPIPIRSLSIIKQQLNLEGGWKKLAFIFQFWRGSDEQRIPVLFIWQRTYAVSSLPSWLWRPIHIGWELWLVEKERRNTRKQIERAFPSEREAQLNNGKEPRCLCHKTPSDSSIYHWPQPQKSAWRGVGQAPEATQLGPNRGTPAPTLFTAVPAQ